MGEVESLPNRPLDSSKQTLTVTDEELRRLLTDLESDRVERKASFAERDKVRQAICAFANDLPDHGGPGVIFLGARDDGACAGLRIDDQLLQQLGGIRAEGQIQPLPSVTVEKRTVDGCELAVVVVQPSQAPPVRFRGRTWIRIGPRRAIATPEEERRLAERRRAGDLPFDLRPLSSASVDDLDLDLFERVYLRAAVAPDVLEQNRRSLREQLQALRFLDRFGAPTTVGVLVVGKDPRGFVPGDYVQFLRLDGTDLVAPIRDQKEIDGPIPELLRRLDEVMEAHNPAALSLDGGPTDVRKPSYPLPALQQLARNAVLHRSYEGSNAPVRLSWFSDRIEIQSPGGPYGQVTAANFGEPGITDYRNPYLAEAMAALGYVQRFGVGIQIARQALEQNGNPPPEFVVEATHVLVTVRAA